MTSVNLPSARFIEFCRLRTGKGKLPPTPPSLYGWSMLVCTLAISSVGYIKCTEDSVTMLQTFKAENFASVHNN